MLPRVFHGKTLKLPITLGIVMIVLLVVLTVGWVLLSVVGALKDSESAGLYWAILSIGTTLLVLVLVGVVMYLALSIKAINLTRRQSNFIDSVTHELKSPIASLKLYLQTLNRRQVSQSEKQSFYQFMLEDVDRLDRLINHLLDAGRLERTAADEQPEDVPVDAVLRECAETICLRHRVPLATVNLDLTPSVVPAVCVDLEMIFRNLIDNSIKYAGSDPQVDVALRPNADGTVVVRIGDNGCGIPKHQRRKIFGRFVRLGLELERKRPGTGLGLYIVRTLVKKWHGTIRVRDAQGGDGTVFEVRLPGRKTPVPQSEAAAVVRSVDGRAAG